jgi:tRNA (guanine-N7-)-methyltransferase
MPRRKLARRLDFIPPDVQTAQKYLLCFDSRDLFHNPENYPKLTAANLFGNDGPLHLEIGCGVGEFICALASKELAANFVGIDISWKPLFKAIRTASSLSLNNLKFIKANFKLVYPLLMPSSLQAVYLHFPDPHQEPKFQKRHIFGRPFLDQMHRVLRPRGRLSVMTDHAEFFMDMIGLMEQDPRFEKLHPERFLVGFETETKSRFQRLWESHGLPTLRFEVRKKEGSSGYL